MTTHTNISKNKDRGEKRVCERERERERERDWSFILIQYTKQMDQLQIDYSKSNIN